MNGWLILGYTWGLCSLVLLMIVVIPTKNPETGRKVPILVDTTWFGFRLGFHMVIVVLLVLAGPLTWVGLVIAMWRDYHAAKYPAYPPDA